ncbi:MAG: transcriptional repressor NrdR [Victivallales bacterium]|jgi:transcriptional repressor NrdR|nr:transcriptional repressor NrdR [Victivallales bacterium]MBT7298316.1 transcriptional repressor NrdR [Victivallales bacterium]
MRCPKCGCLDDKVIETRASREGDMIRRRRECLGCQNRFTTRETLGVGEVVVVKRDGSREEFDPEKIHSGIRHACWKRTVSEKQIDRVVADIARRLNNLQQREIESKRIGEFVMESLQELDEVAYVRFASIYRRFTGIGEFIDEVRNLSERADVPEDEASPEP